MTNNDVLRDICDTFGFDESKIVAIFGLADLQVTPEEVGNWLIKDDAPDFQQCSDTQLATFLNGLIIERRGKKEGPQPEPEEKITNNIIFRKLRIALDLQAEDMMEILALAEISLSKHALSALFRKPKQKHYRNCKDEILAGFLKGVQLMYSEESK